APQLARRRSHHPVRVAPSAVRTGGRGPATDTRPQGHRQGGAGVRQLHLAFCGQSRYCWALVPREPGSHVLSGVSYRRRGMKIHRLYTDDKGDSHFTDAEVEYVETTQAGRLSKRLQATGIIFREVPPTYDLDWHPAP